MIQFPRANLKQQLATYLKPLLVMDKFSGGTVTLVDQARLAENMASGTTNLIQTQDGLWSQRWGRSYYGTAIAGESTLDGVGEYRTTAGASELIAVGGTTGKIWRSQNDGAAWSQLGSIVLTAGNQAFMLQSNNLLLIANGVDNLVEYNGTTTSQFSALSAPTNLSLSLTGLTSGNYTAYYQVTAVNNIGETLPCTEQSISVNLTRDNWVSPTDAVNLTWNSVNGATRYQIYYADESGFEMYLDSVNATHYVDDGTAPVSLVIAPPTSNSTTAPKFKQMILSDNLVWAVGDPNNPWTVYFADSTELSFAAWDSGGYLTLEYGGREVPQAVVHYRGGSGESLPTVLCSDAEGIGSIWQINDQKQTVTDANGSTYDIDIKNPVKVVGSLGTTSPLAVISAGNDIYFPNKQGIYSLGNAPNLLNILQTNEKSQLIRPSYRGMNQSLIKNMCGIFYDAKVIFSCTIGTANDTTFIHDTERENWNWSWDFGAKQWLQVTDAGGTSHLIYVPSTGNQLVEVSSNFSTDFGNPIKTSYISGLYSFNKDDTMFANVREVVVSLGNFQGEVTIEVLGIDAKKGFSTLGSKTVTDAIGAITWVESVFDQYRFSYRKAAPKIFAQPSTKKQVKVGKKMNRIQINISSTTAGTQFTILSCVVHGAIIPTQIPASWKS